MGSDLLGIGLGIMQGIELGNGLGAAVRLN